MTSLSISLVRYTASYSAKRLAVKSASREHNMALSPVADEGDCLQIWRAAVNI
jgi:hypothetical protein